MTIGSKAKASFHDILVTFNSKRCTFNGGINRTGGVIGDSAIDYKKKDFRDSENKIDYKIDDFKPVTESDIDYKEKNFSINKPIDNAFKR